MFKKKKDKKKDPLTEDEYKRLGKASLFICKYFNNVRVKTAGFQRNKMTISPPTNNLIFGIVKYIVPKIKCVVCV